VRSALLALVDRHETAIDETAAVALAEEAPAPITPLNAQRRERRQEPRE